MESLPRDPYERQLLEVFKSCDFDGKGVLDDAGLEKLCELLHLEEAREELRSFLVPNGSGTSSPVTFSKFRDALLTLLGGLRGDRTPSPVREVSPKYVYGEKKYGRRSRPESIEKLEQLDNSNSESNEIKITNTLHSSSLNNIRLCSSSDNDQYSVDSDLDAEEVEPITKISINKEYEASGESELRNAWERLGVGREGYLHRNELAMVCSAVGMDTMADQVVSQVFSTLKTDDEGRILFEDFLELFRPKNLSSQIVETNQNQFSKSSLDELSISATSRLFQELNNARIQLEAVTAERDKLKADLAEANERSTMLAQEVDEHHARIEKASRDQIELIEQKHQDDIKTLKYQMSAEKDQLLSSNQRLEKSLTEHLDQLNKLNSELTSLKLECENLEKENRTLSNELAGSDSLKKDFQEQQECLSSLHQRVYELESLHEQSSGIIQRINSLQSENTELRDKNDELTIQLEQLLTQNSHRKDSLSDCTGTKRRVKSPEFFSVTRLEKVRRCETDNDISLTDISSQDFSITVMDEKDLEVEDDTYSISAEQIWIDEKEKMKAYVVELEAKVRQLQQKELWKTQNGFYETQEIGVQTETPLGHLEKHCYELETELERVRDKIIKILSERRACSEENCALKKTLQTLMKKNVDFDPFLSSAKNSECLESALNMECIKCDALNLDNQRLLRRCQDLEKSLDLLKDEYEKTEDYWEKKLEEERNIFEKDQEQSDEKFAELELKIQEYAELFAIEQSKKPSLPPIEENEYFEKQFTQLEDEFEKFRIEMNQQLGLKDEQIEKLGTALENCQRRPTVLDEGVQTNFGETSKLGAKFRPSSIPREDSDYCCCARGKAREKLKSEIENLCQRKRVLLNQIARLHTTGQLAMPRMDNVHVFQSLASRLRQQEVRCGELQSALRRQQKETDHILQKAWERHKYDLQCIQSSLKSTQEQLQQQRKSTKQQIDKLNASDALVKELCFENKNLVQMLTGLEQKYQSMSHPVLPNSI